MLAFILRRLASMVLVLWVVVTLTFLIVYVAPGDPFVKERDIPETILKQMKARYKVDGPMVNQYFSYLGDLLKGDSHAVLGWSGDFSSFNGDPKIKYQHPEDEFMIFTDSMQVPVGVAVIAGKKPARYPSADTATATFAIASDKKYRKNVWK